MALYYWISAMLQWQGMLNHLILMLKSPKQHVAMVTAAPSSLLTMNVAAYLAGYLLSKIPADIYQDCSHKLILLMVPSPHQDLSCIRSCGIKHQEAGCLVYPTPAMVTFVDNFKSRFSAIFEWIFYMPHVLARLCKSADEVCTFLESKAVQCCLQLKGVVKLYIKYKYFTL